MPIKKEYKLKVHLCRVLAISNMGANCGSELKSTQSNHQLSTLEPLNSGPLNSGKPLINRQARLDQWIFHYIKPPH